ncbi:cell wall-active antibiotics response protein LiaF [Paenibacillus glacialis]|uniref:Cell wall-active antibiotics response protein n=1 Tax=Paenibacillus glacialis TaxID=494026 RepID=A0A168NQ92_9BACL|nr:cell wall-active antibiotics response protein LiaF [Paenibacillus glacialis]OAB46024.1 hypothetical protein PGLA_01090 [Paenibacillus glacialis]
MRKGWSDRFFGGLVLIGIGVIFLLQQMGYVDISLGSIISTYWPLILIYAGLKNLLTSRGKGGSFLGAFILIAVGGYFQARALDWDILSPGDFFKYLVPGFLILCGLHVIFKPHRSEPSKKMKPPIVPISPLGYPPEPSELPNLSDLDEGTESTLDKQFEEKFGVSFADKNQEKKSGTFDMDFDDDSDKYEEEDSYNNCDRRNKFKDKYKDKYNRKFESFSDGEKINKSAFIGDVHMGREYFELKPTNISQFIGDTVLDLTKAQIPYGKTKINISAFIGDIKIYVPDDMDLGIKVNSSSFIGDMSILSESKSGFMSSVQTSSTYFKESQKKIVINVSAFIGDIKVNRVG